MNNTNARSWADVKAEAAARRTPKQEAEYAEGLREAEQAFELAELVYNARKDAGLTQSELAKLIGSRQSVISEIEGGGQTPSFKMLERIAYATGTHLRVALSA